MEKAMKVLSGEGLVFFGKVITSISHELNNILANISETVGLMNELSEPADHDGRLDVNTLRLCSEEVSDEIRRGAFTIKQMNRFSHSVDEPIKMVSILEMLDLAVNLSRFLRDSSNVSLDRSDSIDLKLLTMPCFPSLLAKYSSTPFPKASEIAIFLALATLPPFILPVPITKISC